MSAPPPSKAEFAAEKAQLMMQVWVKKLTGAEVAVQVAKIATVAELKQAVADAGGPVADVQRIIYEGQQLGNDQSLANAGVGNEATVHVVQMLR